MNRAESIFKRALGAVVAFLLVLPSLAHAAPEPKPGRDVDIVIALDVSGSMSGLIESAKQRLWDIVNEMGRAKPQPNLRVALFTYGNPAYGSDNGYVRLDAPLTHDLDKINEKLFALTTSGGDEYVSRVVTKAVEQLSWSEDPNALKIVFVAGNEGANQDPQISVTSATSLASSNGIFVNTIFCGHVGGPISLGWKDFALKTDGTFASIDQNAAMVAEIKTPVDDEIVALNAELNRTYVGYGQLGARRKANQARQDSNAARMSGSAAASRVITKSKSVYRSADWDIVGAVREGKKVEEFEEAQLPKEMKAMSKEQRKAHIEGLSKKRAELNKRISKLDRQRQEYIAKERAAKKGDSGLDQAMKKSIRMQAEKRGFSF